MADLFVFCVVAPGSDVKKVVRRYTELPANGADAVITRFLFSEQPLADCGLIDAYHSCELVLTQTFFMHKIAQYFGEFHGSMIVRVRSKVLT